MNKKVILYLGGGSMLGVFGAGVVTKLEEEDFYKKIKVVYGASAGAFNSAYFLANQSKLGSTIYWEDLTNNFIIKTNYLKSLIDEVIRSKPLTSTINIDHLIEVVSTKKVLDIKKIQNQKIPFYVKVYDTKNKKMTYLDARKNTLEKLKFSASVIPYYVPKEQRYVDGDILEHLNTSYLLKKYPNEKIIIIINHKLKRTTSITAKLENYIGGIMANSLFPKNHLKKFYSIKETNMKKEINIAMNNPNTLIIQPPEESPTELLTINPQKLKKTYKLGKREAKKIINFV